MCYGEQVTGLQGTRMLSLFCPPVWALKLAMDTKTLKIISSTRNFFKQLYFNLKIN